MGFLSTIIVAIALFTNVFTGGTSVFSSLWSMHEMGSTMDTEYCVLHCLSATVDAERLELVVPSFYFTPALVVALIVLSLVSTIKRQIFVGALFIRPDPRLYRLVALRE